LQNYFPVLGDPTGIGDSTPAVTAAYNAAIAAGGGHVYFGPGLWKMGTVSIPPAPNAFKYTWPPLVHFQFAGIGATILTPLAANQPLFNVPSGQAAGVRFQGGFTIQAHTGGSTGPAIDLTGARQWVIESVNYFDSLRGAAGVPGTYNQVIGFGLNAYANRIINPICEGQRLGQSFAGVASVSSGATSANLIDNPLLEGNTATYMIDGAGSVLLTVAGGIIEGNTVTAGVRLGYLTAVRNCHFELNVAFFMDGSGVDVVSPGQCFIENCIFNSGSGTLTLPTGTTGHNRFMGPLAALTVIDNAGAALFY